MANLDNDNGLMVFDAPQESDFFVRLIHKKLGNIWWVNENLMFSGDGSHYYPLKSYQEAKDKVVPYQHDIIVFI